MNKLIKMAIICGMSNMKKCLIIINKNAGSCRKISFDRVERILGADYLYTHFTLPCSLSVPYAGYDAIAVCGGDGTLSSIMQQVWNKDINFYYFPAGTLNDKARATKHLSRSKILSEQNKTLVVGRYSSDNDSTNAGNTSASSFCINDYIKKAAIESSAKADTPQKQGLFTYVLAAGSFTPIGYCSSVERKKKFGILVYLANVIKEYKPHKIGAEIATSTHKFSGDFTLIMLIKSPRCFGFSFNRAYNQNAKSGHLLAIRASKHMGALGYVEMFFPFFRAFFIGLKKEKTKGALIFTEADNIKIMLKQDTVFCKDGEKCPLSSGEYSISFERTQCSFDVINRF